MAIKVGIIGLGVGESHITGYQKHPKCEVVALCDFSPEKNKLASHKYPGIKIVQFAEEILEDPQIDVVSIATYDNFHYEQIISAIKTSKHIFVEKPLCLREEEAKDIYSLLDNNPHIKISSNHILRMSPRFQELKLLLERDEVGELYYAEGDYDYGKIEKIMYGWRAKIDYYSVVLGGAIHIIDLLLWLTGERVVEVFSYGNQIATKDSQFRYNDLVVALLQFQNGMLAKISANFGCVKPHFHGLKLYGTKGSFINEVEAGILFQSRDCNELPKRILQKYPGVHKGDLVYNFIDSILFNTKATVVKRDIFDVLSVCFAIEKSLEIKQRVKVTYFGED